MTPIINLTSADWLGGSLSDSSSRGQSQQYFFQLSRPLFSGKMTGDSVRILIL